MPLAARYIAIARGCDFSLISSPVIFSLPSDAHVHSLLPILPFFSLNSCNTPSIYNKKSKTSNSFFKFEENSFYFIFPLDFSKFRDTLSAINQMPTWRNGRRAAFRSQSVYAGEGSSPFVGTNLIWPSSPDFAGEDFLYRRGGFSNEHFRSGPIAPDRGAISL